MTGDPAMQEWRRALGASTSAQLRGSQAYLAKALDEAEHLRGELADARRSLAASQADLTRVEGELAWEREVVAMLRRNEEIRAQVIRERNAERDRLREELTEAQKPCAYRGLADDLLRERPGKIYAARGPSGICVLCGGPIVRSQAVEAAPSVDSPIAGTKGSFQHAVCPDRQPAEQWRPVVGFEGRLEVSDRGNVASLPVSSRHFRIVLRQKTEPQKGYRVVNPMVGGRRFNRRVHILVAEAFLGPRPAGAHIRHLDGNPANNMLENLQYGTPSENVADTIRHGRHTNTEKTHCKRGHAFDDENNFIRTADGGRICRKCKRAYNKASYDRVGKPGRRPRGNEKKEG